MSSGTQRLAAYALTGTAVGAVVSYAASTPHERSKPEYHPKLLWGAVVGTATYILLVHRPSQVTT